MLNQNFKNVSPESYYKEKNKVRLVFYNIFTKLNLKTN